MKPQFVLTICCPDVRGVVAATTTFLAEARCSIVEAHQHQDGGTFFMRLAFDGDGGDDVTATGLSERFRATAERFEMDASFVDRSVKPRVLLMVSKFGHCLFDLLNRWRNGQLDVEVVGVVSNHDAMRSFVEWNGLPYHHFPVTSDSKAEQEQKIIDLVDEAGVDLVVLARYMQILSPRLCEALSGRCINIHHSFLPSFKGAKPYHQAHARGVKVIGATAHYVTTDLDEGPIIEQDTRRVSHARSADDLVIIGQEVECSVLGRAVSWHIDQRVLMNGHQTIVFE
ncbi:formyltetrahydrofolate deformylase [Sphingobium sp.]|uniref:formyltetrahydrofolate deformylase n=1 Tax=Sphingobium sp. TaxID=1912891 RepID=UPI0028BEB76A|nr:formyltetrahydrofolate deformylase [Sphingobium sp.]